MGDVSVIARRLKDGHVQHGWSGNDGYFSMLGWRLLKWYMDPELVEYLFSLGQARLIGAPNSEKGGCSWFDTHDLTRRPHYLGNCEDDMFSKIAFIEYGYFFDTDNKWYYIIPGMLTIKVPLELIANNVDERGNEFKYRNQLENELFKYILTDYVEEDKDFASFLHENGYDGFQLLEMYEDEEYPFYELCDKQSSIMDYFDRWVVVRSDLEFTEISEFIMKRKTENHIETIEW